MTPRKASGRVRIPALSTRHFFTCGHCGREQLRYSARDSHGLTERDAYAIGWSQSGNSGWYCPGCNPR